MDQSNSLKRKLGAGEPVVGAQSTTFSTQMVELYGGLGLDFAWVDFEHLGPGPYDSTLLADLTMAAETSGTELLVRLPSGEQNDLIRKVVDAGVRNVLFPRVETAGEVRHALEATRFVHDGKPGRRGAGIGRSASYGTDFDAAYARREDENVLFGVMIENTTAVENLDEILAVPELGFVMVGPNDLSVSAGRPFEREHDEIEAMTERTRRQCREADVPVGRPVSDATAASAAIDEGYQFVSLATEVTAIQEWFGDCLRALGRDPGTDSNSEY